jgi:hypothetical protein
MLLLAWSAVKIGFVESVLPARTADRNARETGEHLAGLVPEGEILYLCKLKDEGVLFYYCRPARRLANPESPGNARYLLLLDDEWKASCGLVELAELRDQQQAVIHLARRDEGWQAHERPNPPTSSPFPR